MAANEFSKTQIDRLGDRLKKGDITDDDLRLLDTYRRSFSEAYEMVVGCIRDEMAMEPTGRRAKSTSSISDKLRRESIRLTQIQDIAGCRLIVSNIAAQENVLESLKGIFENVTVVDRRKQPSHGYRAVHAIVSYSGKVVKIQIRTVLQQLWTEMSEKFSDVVEPAIKYGGGDENIQELLSEMSILVDRPEAFEVKLEAEYTKSADDKYRQTAIVLTQVDFTNLKQETHKLLQSLTADAEKFIILRSE